MPTELRRHLETKRMRQATQIINGSLYDMATFYRLGIRIESPTIQRHSLRGHWVNFIVNLECVGWALGNKIWHFYGKIYEWVTLWTSGILPVKVFIIVWD